MAAPPPKKMPGSPLPGWMAPVLLVIAVPGMLLMLRALWVCFAGDGPFQGRLLVTRFEDRATWWVMVGPGSASSWATLAALTAFTVVVFSRRHHHPAVPSRLRLTAFGLTALLSLLELSGPLTVAGGWFQLSQDPTAARSFWDDDLINGPQLVLCLVLAVLAALIAWVLHSGPLTNEEPPQSDSTDATASTRWADDVGETAGVEDVQGIFRRPTPRPSPPGLTPVNGTPNPSQRGADIRDDGWGQRS